MSPSLYEQLGGDATFFQIVDAFYAGVAEDPVLRPLYPEDLEPPRHRLALFLIQAFGGPATYFQERGHPRLRLRHAPFPIDRAARDHWMRHMRAAVEAADLPPSAREQLLAYFERAATSLINQWPWPGSH